MKGEELHRSLKTGLLVIFAFGFGVLTGLFGVGPGFIGVLLLVYLFGLTASNARSFVTLLILAAAVPAMIVYATHDRVDWGSSLEAALGAIIGALISKMVFRGDLVIAARRVLSLVLLALGVTMILRSHDVALWKPGYDLTLGRAFVVGTGSGFIASIASLATGLFLVPALVFINGVPQRVAQSLALAAIIPACIPLAYTHFALGGVDKAGLLQYIAAAALGGVAGAAISFHIKDPAHATVTFGIYLVVLSVLILVRPRV